MSAANFETVVLPFTLKYEGGRVDDPRDPGGRTNRGITQKTFDAYCARVGQPARDVYGMTDDEMRAIYRKSFWVTVKGDSLADGVDLAMFDYGVNSGPARALKTYAKRSSNDATTIVQSVCASRLAFDQGLAVWNTFKRGWTARVAACEALGVKMAEHARIGVPVAAPPTPGTAAKLDTAGKAAASKAASHGKAAGATAAGGAVVHPAVSAGIHLSWPLMILAGLAILAIVALILWRASQQQARSVAYAALAKDAAPIGAAVATNNFTPPAAKPGT